ncbi:translocator protein homolog [Primulina eburnea]|uniref:translocator protein homolog n=1 Tax=Primulina eburnea TaxID=1245227 RepID=UPI003C6C574F
MQYRKQKRTGMAARGLRSLAIAIILPLSLTVLDIILFGSGDRFRSMQRHPYFPPMWALHSAWLVAAFLSGLSAWLVWVDGGFHHQPGALFLYLGQLALSLGWYPIVFGAGAIRVGLILCAALFGSLIACSRIFKNVNPIAGDLFKPCLLWGMLLAVVNVRLVYQW